MAITLNPTADMKLLEIFKDNETIPYLTFNSVLSCSVSLGEDVSGPSLIRCGFVVLKTTEGHTSMNLEQGSLLVLKDSNDKKLSSFYI